MKNIPVFMFHIIIRHKVSHAVSNRALNSMAKQCKKSATPTPNKIPVTNLLLFDALIMPNLAEKWSIIAGVISTTATINVSCGAFIVTKNKSMLASAAPITPPVHL